MTTLKKAVTERPTTPNLSGLQDQINALETQTNASNTYIDSGAADAYLVTSSVNQKSIASYFDTLTISLKITNSNTGASTINIDGLGVKDIRDSAGGVLSGGELLVNIYYTFVYNASAGYFEIF